MTRRDQLIASLADPAYRQAFVEQRVDALLPFQLRALREQRGWTQQQLGERCGKAQAWICKLENPTYARFSLQTLKTLAAAFDVALDVRFIPFSDFVDRLSNRRVDDLRVPSFAADAGLSTDASVMNAIANLDRQLFQVPQTQTAIVTGSKTGQFDFNFPPNIRLAVNNDKSGVGGGFQSRINEIVRTSERAGAQSQLAQPA